MQRQTIGEILRYHRIQRRYSMAELALRAGVSRSTLSRCEAGFSDLSREVAVRLADVLDLSPEDQLALIGAPGHTHRRR